MLSVGGDNTPPTELYNLRPDRIQIRTGQRAMPQSYDYMIGGQIVESYEVDQATGNSKIKHIKMFNPLDDYYGSMVDYYRTSEYYECKEIKSIRDKVDAITFREQEKVAKNKAKQPNMEWD